MGCAQSKPAPSGSSSAAPRSNKPYKPSPVYVDQRGKLEVKWSQETNDNTKAKVTYTINADVGVSDSDYIAIYEASKSKVSDYLTYEYASGKTSGSVEIEYCTDPEKYYDIRYVHKDEKFIASSDMYLVPKSGEAAEQEQEEMVEMAMEKVSKGKVVQKAERSGKLQPSKTTGLYKGKPLNSDGEVKFKHPGVSMEFLNLVITNPKISTDDFVKTHIKPKTEEKKLDYISNYIQLYNEDAVLDRHGIPMFGEANRFVSHSWKYPIEFTFLCMLEEQEKTDETLYFWFDIFSVNQHRSSTRSQDFWATSFKKSIEEIGTTLLVMYPHDKPVCVSRCWCLWEILSSVENSKVKFTPAITDNQFGYFCMDVIRDPSMPYNALASIDSSKAEAFVPEDQEMILKAVQDSVGFDKLNSSVTDALKAFYFSSLQRVAEESTTVLDRYPLGQRINLQGINFLMFGDYQKALTCFQNGLKWFEKVLKESSVDPMPAFHYNKTDRPGTFFVACSHLYIGLAQALLGKGKDAAKSMNNALPEFERIFGASSAEVTAIKHNVNLAEKKNGSEGAKSEDVKIRLIPLKGGYQLLYDRLVM